MPTGCGLVKIMIPNIYFSSSRAFETFLLENIIIDGNILNSPENGYFNTQILQFSQKFNLFWGCYTTFCLCPYAPHSLILEDLYSEPYMLSLHEETPIVSLFMSKTNPFCTISLKSYVFPSLRDRH